MNIIVKPYGSNLCYCRPDTTWERENKDFYSPECVNDIYWTPVVFARVSKAGKCVGKKLVERYYDGIGCGMLMYCSTSGSEENSGDPRLLAQTPPSRGWHVTSVHLPTQNTDTTSIDIRSLSEVVDKSSILPHPLFQPVVLEDAKEFVVNTSPVILSGAKDLLEEAICNASQLTSLRIGDFVAVELATPAELAKRENGEVTIKGTFCENEIFGFKIIF